MNELLAFTPKQLDICLKLLYAEHVGFELNVFETEKRKIAYKVTVESDEQTVGALKEKYRILIS